MIQEFKMYTVVCDNCGIEYGRRNYGYDEHFGGAADRAYYDGRVDYEREELIRVFLK